MGVGGGQGVQTPSKNLKAIGVLSNTGPDPLENYKATKPAVNVLGHYRPVSKTPFKWHFAGGPMLTRFLCYLDPLSPNKLKTTSELDPSG